MKKVNVVNLKGENVKELKLNENVFGIEPNDIVLKKALRLQLDSLRQGTAKTKNRSEVSGGGRKPYRQKGTGNARQGSTRAVQFRHGGIIFGPTPRDYTFKTNKKEKTLALKSALSHKVEDKELVVIDKIELKDMKTKAIKTIIETLKLEGKVLFVTKEDAENLYMATRNLGYADAVMVEDLSVLDIVNSDTIVFDESAINFIEEALN
ncbi:MAG TPA: 50S ribosomal protein L4 [Firmicutes bacterium]|nr:50S ribosomal protein L4 [Bacillota bacterium]